MRVKGESPASRRVEADERRLPADSGCLRHGINFAPRAVALNHPSPKAHDGDSGGRPNGHPLRHKDPPEIVRVGADPRLRRGDPWAPLIGRPHLGVRPADGHFLSLPSLLSSFLPFRPSSGFACHAAASMSCDECAGARGRGGAVLGPTGAVRPLPMLFAKPVPVAPSRTRVSEIGSRPSRVRPQFFADRLRQPRSARPRSRSIRRARGRRRPSRCSSCSPTPPAPRPSALPPRQRGLLHRVLGAGRRRLRLNGATDPRQHHRAQHSVVSRRRLRRPSQPAQRVGVLAGGEDHDRRLSRRLSAAAKAAARNMKSPRRWILLGL